MIIFCIIISALLVMFIITTLILIHEIDRSNARINDNHNLVFAVINNLAHKMGLDSHFDLRHYDINDLHDNTFRENNDSIDKNLVEKKLNEFKRKIEEYLDIEESKTIHHSWQTGVFVEEKYVDKQFNKLKLLYDHLNLDIQTIQAQPLQYKVVKKKKEMK